MKGGFFMKNIILGTSLLFISMQVFAACFAERCENVIIKKVHILENGTVGLETSGSEVGLGCDLLQGKYIYLPKTSSNYDQLYSLIVASHASENIVDLFIDEEHDDEMCELIVMSAK